MKIMNLIRRFFGSLISGDIEVNKPQKNKSSTSTGTTPKKRLLSPKEQKERARFIEKIYIAREFFLNPGVIRKRSSSGTDEDDR